MQLFCFLVETNACSAALCQRYSTLLSSCERNYLFQTVAGAWRHHPQQIVWAGIFVIELSQSAFFPFNITYTRHCCWVAAVSSILLRGTLRTRACHYIQCCLPCGQVSRLLSLSRTDTSNSSRPFKLSSLISLNLILLWSNQFQLFLWIFLLLPFSWACTAESYLH